MISISKIINVNDNKELILFSGICDPYDSENCSSVNDWEICTETSFVCAALNDPGKYTLYNLLMFTLQAD